MKRRYLNSLSFVLLALLGAIAPAAAQSSGTSQVSATIVTPVTLAKEADLAFENVSRRQLSSRQAKAEVMTSVRVSAASFTVSGTANYAYGITMPAQFSMEVEGESVTVGTRLRAANSTGVSSNGTGTFAISGVLSAGAAAPDLSSDAIQRVDADRYDKEEDFIRERGGFPVTIIYN